jgi:hypothetical protein
MTSNDLELMDDQRLSPVIVHWLREYVLASDGDRDAIVARMLTELNALLVRFPDPDRAVPERRGEDPRISAAVLD